MNYYNEIKSKLIDNEINKRVKDYSKNKSDLDTYYNVGKLLSEAGKHYGEGIIKEYSIRLTKEIGKGYNISNLKRMRQFYNVFSNEKVSTMWTLLTWSHIRLLFNLNLNALNYYIQITIDFCLSVRELEYKIKSNEYERLPEETKNKLIKQEKEEAQDLIKNLMSMKVIYFLSTLYLFYLKPSQLNNYYIYKFRLKTDLILNIWNFHNCLWLMMKC